MEVIAQQVMNRAQEIARREGHPICISVVDPSGLPYAFLRMDNAVPGAIDIAVKKARTAALFRTDSIAIGAEARPSGSIYTLESTNGGLISFGGGVVIYDDAGNVIGALGISGAPVEVDQAIAMEAAGRL
ncbi:GlcG/HbpS family heme-binding protein [Pseudomonas fulva]|uniref:GlcG/HbpS family heme-binding protein n=1 Tax=Pseudomonas fulva TaxID=47880 RepID=UPI0018AA2794|nr:heme-binding protein [Pseudomonas fulva]MBF8774083.1 heme-binding protein [Pseudomonas fulva]